MVYHGGEVDDDPWGLGYKLVKKKLRATRSTQNCGQNSGLIVPRTSRESCRIVQRSAAWHSLFHYGGAGKGNYLLSTPKTDRD